MFCLLGLSCRSRVTKHLSTKFKSLSEAEEELQIDYVLNSCDNEESGSTPQRTMIPNDETLSPIFNCSPVKNAKPVNTSVGDMVREFLTCFKTAMSSRLRTQLLHHIFKLTVVEDDGLEFFKFVKNDFLTSSLSAMKTLFKEEKHNLIYHLSKCFESSSPRMPVDRMPYGLLDYNIRFFASSRTQKLGMEEHYSSWLETMFSQFGHKWLCLHRGPVWKYDLDAVMEASLQGTCDLNDKSTDMDGAELDVIQSALQQSSLSLDLEESNGTLKTINTSHGAELDVIQSALQQSSLSLDLEEGNGTLDTLNTTLGSMCIASTDVPTCSSPIHVADENPFPFEENDALQNVSSELCREGEVVQVSHLWTRVSDHER